MIASRAIDNGVKFLKQIVLKKFMLTLVVVTATTALLYPQSAWSVKDLSKPRLTKKVVGLKLLSKKFSVRSGDTLYSILKRFDFNQSHMSQILGGNVLPKGYNLMIGEKYRVSEQPNIKQVTIEFFDRDKDIVYKYWKKGPKKAGAEREKRNFNVKIKTYKGKVKGAIIGSIKKVVPDKLVPYRFLDAYVWDQNLRRTVARGSHFSLTLEEKYEDDEFVKYGEILKTELEISGEIVTRHFVAFKDGGSFVDPNKKQTDRPLYAPVNYVHISSKFQKRRYHPIKKRRIAHLGVDFALPAGEEVYAAYAGRVEKTGKNRAAGRYVAIRHPNGMTSFYNHMSEVSKHIKPGLYVSTGELIGKIGCSGYCTKPHLHFALKRSGRFVDPLPFLRSYPFRSRRQIIKQLAKLKNN